MCGIFPENIKLIELFFDILIKISSKEVLLYGYSQQGLIQAKKVIIQLYELANEPIQIDMVHSLLGNKQPQTYTAHSIKLGRKTIISRNKNQESYLDSIDKNSITFAIGPAGTGKTYLAVSKAVEAFEQGKIQRLVLVRPAVEAGEKLGFLPGDLIEKVLPFLRPIYDALYDMLGFKETQKLIQTDIIEILPLAFMRGRTLNDSFIILDEAQNTTIPQMKMFLTRMGFGSKTIITGDITQIDLPRGVKSGLVHANKLFASSIPGIKFHYFNSKDVMRHPLVSQIINCYEHNQDITE